MTASLTSDNPALWLQLTGQTEDHLVALPGTDNKVLVHTLVASDLLTLMEQAGTAGFALTIASGFRSYARQLLIWNEKVEGKRAVMDNRGFPLDISTLDPRALVYAILRWSALPGCSRHHWGTDFDIYDQHAVSAGYKVQLSTDETIGTGPFSALHTWLDAQINCNTAAGFYRPYAADHGGIAPERWHISHAPTAAIYEKAAHKEAMADFIAHSDILLKDIVLQHWDDIFPRFIQHAHHF